MSALLCRIFGHRRRKHTVRFSPLGWRSRCLHCGVTLLRTSKGWNVPDAVELDVS